MFKFLLMEDDLSEVILSSQVIIPMRTLTNRSAYAGPPRTPDEYFGEAGNWKGFRFTLVRNGLENIVGVASSFTQNCSPQYCRFPIL
jgi:hypothetical protein